MFFLPRVSPENFKILAAWKGWGRERAERAKSNENADKIWQAYVDIFHKALPEVVAQYDQQRSYWSSGPLTVHFKVSCNKTHKAKK